MNLFWTWQWLGRMEFYPGHKSKNVPRMGHPALAKSGSRTVCR
jgi:hypothetical protein